MPQQYLARAGLNQMRLVQFSQARATEQAKMRKKKRFDSDIIRGLGNIFRHIIVISL